MVQRLALIALPLLKASPIRRWLPPLVVYFGTYKVEGDKLLLATTGSSRRFMDPSTVILIARHRLEWDTFDRGRTVT